MANTCTWACANNTQNETACDNNCASDCSGNCYFGCLNGCESVGQNLPENETGDKDGDPNDRNPGDKDSNDEENKEVNYTCNNATQKDKDTNGQLGCPDRANNTCANSGSSNYCTNDCVSGCASCSGECGSGCSGGCSSCSGCSGSCSGSCRGSCSSCRGTCDGGCQDSCEGRCDKGCTSQEQEDNAKVTLDRIVNVENVKNIFKFVVYEARRRAAHPYYNGQCKGKEGKFNEYVALLNEQTATDPMKYNNISLTPYTTTTTNEEGKEVIDNGYVSKELTEPITIEAYKELYVDNNGEIQYGRKDINGISFTKPKTFNIGTYDKLGELDGYFFNLNENDEAVVSRYIITKENEIAYQKYRYTIELKEDQSNKIFLLYYNVPRVFENTLNFAAKQPDIQSGTLTKNLNNIYEPKLIDRNDSVYDFYANKLSAQQWIDMARELYNEVLGYHDAR